MALPLYIVDAFTEKPFAGNPAAVCLLDRAREDLWMQALAAEMNLSETAFLLPEGADFQLRWLTPSVEVDLCGSPGLRAQPVPAAVDQDGSQPGRSRRLVVELVEPLEPLEQAVLYRVLGITADEPSRQRVQPR